MIICQELKDGNLVKGAMVSYVHISREELMICLDSWEHVGHSFFFDKIDQVRMVAKDILLDYKGKRIDSLEMVKGEKFVRATPRYEGGFDYCLGEVV